MCGCEALNKEAYSSVEGTQRVEENRKRKVEFLEDKMNRESFWGDVVFVIRKKKKKKKCGCLLCLHYQESSLRHRWRERKRESTVVSERETREREKE